MATTKPPLQTTQSNLSVGAQLKKIESYQYPNTHVNHLTDEQAEALSSLKEISEQGGVYQPAGPGRSAPTHDDETLLRYLRARKFAPQEAFQQLRDTEKWRKENEIDKLYETIDVDEYDETRRLYPQWTGRRDRRGIPVYVFEVASLNSRRMAAYEKSISKSKMRGGTTGPKLLRLFALYENLMKFTMPLCSAIADRPYPETPISQSNNLVDISGVGLKQFWNLKQHMQDASQLATAHYPESLDRIFVIGAPSFFPTVWSWIKGWFDPITVSKIFILSRANVEATLSQYIDKANIPKKYGGEMEWEWGDVPNLDPAITDTLHWHNPQHTQQGHKAFPPGPVKWFESPEGNMVAHALGTLDGKQRNEVIATLPLQKDLNIGPSVTTQTRGDAILGVPSARPGIERIPTTSGEHTHPGGREEFIPESGDTPLDDGESSIHGSLDSSQRDTNDGEEANVDPRSGTSTTRYMAQKGTHAAGTLKQGTPAIVIHDNRDTAQVMDPSTVGQAPKSVEIPVVEEEEPSKGYLQQVKDAAGAAYQVASGAGENVLSAVGIKDSGNGTEENGELSMVERTKNMVTGGSSEASHTDESANQDTQRDTKDPRIDAMPQKDVEEYLRSQVEHKDMASNIQGRSP